MLDHPQHRYTKQLLQDLPAMSNELTPTPDGMAAKAQ